MKQQKVNHFAIPKMNVLIRDQWADEIAELLETTPENIRSGEMDLYAAPLGTVRVELMDDSFVEFRNACCIVNGGKRAITVLTEHCGYHVFPIHEAKIYREGKLVYQQIGSDYP
jgi:hypothetical protein